MLYFYSFCCLIGKNPEDQLLTSLNYLLKSLDHFVKDYELILYTNFNVNINNPKLKIRNYYDNTKQKLYSDHMDGGYTGKWLNLSYNKINIYKDLRDETGIDYTWIDLDTIITWDISYLSQVDNFFVVHGGNCIHKTHWIVHDHFSVPENAHIQGAIFKLNLNLYNNLMALVNELKLKKLRLCYDLQSLFAYYFYVKLDNKLTENGINVYGLNYQTNTLNGLGVWCESEHVSMHAHIGGLDNFYLDNGVLKTKYYPDKEIHILMFTFFSMHDTNIINTDKFKQTFSYLFN